MRKEFSGNIRSAHVHGRLSALLLASVAMLAAVDAGSIAQAQSAVAAQQASFSMPSQDLGRALTSFADKAGLRLLFPSSLVAGKTAPALNGTYTAEMALSVLLSGSGLSYTFTSPGTATITSNLDGAHGPIADDGSLVLETIRVTGVSGKPGDAPYETPGSSSYISGEQIERFRGASAGDIFKGTPGVIAASNRNGSSVNVNIRGLQGQNRVKVAIDGTQQTTSTWRGYLGADDRTYIDPDLIGGVSIMKGPTGTAEGAGSIGGVVGIRTINAQDIVAEGNEYGARIKTGISDNADTNFKINAFNQRTDSPALFDFENWSGSAAFATTQENFDLVTAVARRKSGNYFAGTKGETHYITGSGARYPLSYTKPGEEVFNSSSETMSALIKGTLRITDFQSLELGYTRYEGEFGESIGSLLVGQDSTWRQVTPAVATTDTVTARYRWNPDDELFDVRFNLWMTDVEATTRSVFPSFYLPPFITPEGRPPADDPRYSRTKTYGADLTNTSQFDAGIGAFKFDYGWSYVLEDTNGLPYPTSRPYWDSPISSYMNPSVGTREIASIFSRGELEVNEWLTFNAGLRYDAYRIKENGEPFVSGSYTATYADQDGGRLNPSVGIVISPLEGFQFYGSYSEGVRPPSLRETIGSDSLLAPNPNLKSEIASNWEAGINYKMDGVFTDEDAARFKFSYFRNNYVDYISRVYFSGGAGTPYFTTTNLDKAMFSGLELSGSYDAGSFFSEFALTYYTDFEFCRYAATCASATVDADYALNHLPPELNASLTVGFRLFDDKLSFGARINRGGERLGPVPASAQSTNYWLPYTVVDAFASYKVTEHMTVDFKGENIFDRYYIDALDGWMPSPGRTIRASLTAKF